MCSTERTAAVHSLFDPFDVLRKRRELQRHADHPRIEEHMLVESRGTKDADHPVVVG